MKEHLKNLSSRWKYGLIATLAFLGISSAASYYAGFTHSPITQPKTVQTTSIEEQVKGAKAPTATPTDTPIPTRVPTHVYIAPTTVYVPPTQAPSNQTNNQLDNNNYYTNSAGNTVHSPANT